jgi:prepilin-type N-terminal cleavage/methylation domain-containing protein
MSARWERLRRDDSGLTLIELLVSMVLMGLVGTMVFTSVIATQRAAESSRQVNDLNEEARLVLNRMARELREARRVTAVVNPMGPGYNANADTSITFEVDFNGNGTIEPNAADPEVLTYFYDVSTQQLQLKAAGAALPVLAANVAGFQVNFTSRKYIYDGTTTSPGGGVCGTVTGVKDGIVNWEEVDGNAAQLYGNCNATLDTELSVIDSVFINLRVLYGAKQQQYHTQIDLRNANY